MPEKKTGWTKIDNAMLDILPRLQLSGHQSRVFWAIYRKTLGFNKDMAFISVTVLENMTGLTRADVYRAKKDLIKRDLVCENTDSYISKLGIQGDTSKWELSVISHIVSAKTQTPVCENTDKSVCDITDTKKKGFKEKNLKKKTKDINMDDFEKFYQDYPRKGNKPDAKDAWEQVFLKPKYRKYHGPVALQVILGSVEAHKGTERWMKDGGKYIPLSATFLRAHGFNDPVTVDVKQEEEYSLWGEE